MKNKIFKILIVFCLITLLLLFNHKLLNKNDIKLSINVNGDKVMQLPTDGFYELSTYTCNNNSIITWDKYKKKISFSTVIDAATEGCTLDFVSETNTLLLKDVPLGSYVSYTATNGCPTTEVTGSVRATSSDACIGKNANQNSDTSNFTYGYCYDSTDKYITYGWRLAYIYDSDSDGTAEPYLISAASPQCLYSAAYEETDWVAKAEHEKIGGATILLRHHFGSAYIFNPDTGKFSLDPNSTILYDRYDKLGSSANGYYTCPVPTPVASTCTTMNRIISYDTGLYAFIESRTSSNNSVANFNNAAMHYCNPNYAYQINGQDACQTTFNSSTANAWEINSTDFSRITSQWFGSSSSLLSCVSSSYACGYGTDIIDNGGTYKFTDTGLTGAMYGWSPTDRAIGSISTAHDYGIRPIIHLKQNIYVSNGSGTMEDPYIIEYQ